MRASKFVISMYYACPVLSCEHKRTVAFKFSFLIFWENDFEYDLVAELSFEMYANNVSCMRMHHAFLSVE